MKRIQTFKLALLFGIASFGMISCSKDLQDININNNNPEIVPTNTIFNGANRYLFTYSRDGWWMARMTMPWMQYSAQNNYLEEDKYQYRDVQTNNGWNDLFRVASNFKDIIDLCEREDMKEQMANLGNLDNQIAASRIMLTYVFDNLVTHFGDIPYWSYGMRDNPDFQALKIDEYLTPAYSSQELIYKDMLKELKEAAEQLNVDEAVFQQGDNIFQGDAERWKTFANSLRLRIANRIKDQLPEATSIIQEAITAGVMKSNADNAIHASGRTDVEGNALWKAFFTGDRRNDFWVNKSFIDLLKGQTGSFGLDPRLVKFAAPKGLRADQIEKNSYTDSEDLNDYPGLPYGLPQVEKYFQAGENLNFFSSEILRADRGEVLMEYAEVEFILSEVNNWSQFNFEKAIRANMERLEIPSADITAFISTLPTANEQQVITQKYVCLFFNPDEAWNEYRRTGYPDKDILLMPGAKGIRPNDQTEYTFKPLQSGNVIATDLPARVRYPTTQQTLNPDNWKKAADELSGDEIDKKLYFAK